MVEVRIPRTHRQIIRAIAEKRFAANREQDVFNAKIGSQSNEFTDINGFAGEWAFALYYNLFPDLAVEPGSGGIDAVYDGYTVDVKTTEYDDGQLLAPTSKKDRDGAEVYFLVTGDYRDEWRYKLRGFARKERLLQESNLTDLGYGPTYALEQNELEDVPEPHNTDRDVRLSQSARSPST